MIKTRFFLAIAVLAGVVSTNAMAKDYTAKDVIGTYEVSLLLGGTLTFGADGIRTFVMKPAKKGGKPLVIRESYTVKGDRITCKTLEIGGRKVEPKTTVLEILSITEDAMTVRILPTQLKNVYKRVKKKGSAKAK